ncbi:CHAP domain-containing protein [Rhizobium brockwellii]|uniref:CHAP domain-containing protein n=1 Tax=Rhizobium brockwellii TaxID=3019932 RepID=UPI003873C3BE
MNRREFTVGALATMGWGSRAFAEPDWHGQLDTWLQENSNSPTTLGPKLLPASDPSWEEAHAILDNAPVSVAPIDVARYFVTDVPQKWIRAWKDSDFANPVVVLFFAATNTKPSGDTTPWCAAFLNWCLARSGLTGTNSPGSQSFANWGDTVWAVGSPMPGRAKPGNIAVFRHRSDPAHGHVAFYEAVSADQANSIVILGGNHIAGTTHLIQEKTLPIDRDLELRRIASIKGL